MRLWETESIPVPRDIRAATERLQSNGRSLIAVRHGTRFLGMLGIADQPGLGVHNVLNEMRAQGIRTIIMWTGDNRGIGQAVGHKVGVDEVRAELLPEDKVASVQELLKEHGQVAMIGDGVNDTPALATAMVDIAMGAAGSHTAPKPADVALMADDLRKLPYLIRLSRAALRTIRVNIAFSLVIKAIFLGLTLFGYTNLWLAILAETGAALIVIANGMRLLRFRDHTTTAEERGAAAQPSKIGEMV